MQKSRHRDPQLNNTLQLRQSFQPRALLIPLVPLLSPPIPIAAMAPPSASRSSSSNPPPFSSFKNLYLILYNLICALLWLVVLGRVVSLVSLTGFESTYAGVGEFAKWTQTIALLEIVHAAAGKFFQSVWEG